MDWESQLDLLKLKRGVTTEAMLASLVGITKGFLADIRSGRRPMPIGVKLAIADQLDYELTKEMIVSMLDESVQRQIDEIERKRSI